MWNKRLECWSRGFRYCHTTSDIVVRLAPFVPSGYGKRHVCVCNHPRYGGQDTARRDKYEGCIAELGL